MFTTLRGNILYIQNGDEEVSAETMMDHTILFRKSLLASLRSLRSVYVAVGHNREANL